MIALTGPQVLLLVAVGVPALLFGLSLLAERQHEE